MSRKRHGFVHLTSGAKEPVHLIEMETGDSITEKIWEVIAQRKEIYVRRGYKPARHSGDSHSPGYWNAVIFNPGSVTHVEASQET